MKQRIITGSIMAVFGLVMIYFGGTVFAACAIVCFIIAFREEYHALAVAGHRPVSWPTWVALIVCVPIAALTGSENFSLIILSTCVLTLACVIFRDDPLLEDAVMSLLPLFSILLPGLCIVSLSRIDAAAWKFPVIVQPAVHHGDLSISNDDPAH